MTDTHAPWVEGFTIGGMLRESARRHPSREAMVFPRLDVSGTGVADSGSGFRMTFAELDAAVDEIARALLALGLERGDHVAVWSTNWPRWALLQFATARIGAVMVTVNPAYRASELAYVLEQSDARALFLLDRFRSSDYFGMLAEAVPDLAEHPAGTPLDVVAYPMLRHVFATSPATAAGIGAWDQFVAGRESVADGALAERESELDPLDPINIQYTSGTTGFPKGATLSHRNLLLNAHYVAACQQLGGEDRVCVPVPFYHCFGCVMGVLACAEVGATLVVPNEHFDAEATLDAVEAERATSLYGVPTMFIAQLEHPTFSNRDTSSLRTGIMAGSPCPIEVMKRVAGDMGCREITIAYGLTEASPVITQTRTADPLELRVETVGRPLPGLEVAVVDPESGRPLGDDEQGELRVRGHCVMLGYHRNPQATAAAVDGEGWLRTGDLAVRRPDGYYRITGRMKDMICRGGENVYPREIEEFLYSHPAVRDVAIVGVPDPKYVEEIAAWIVLRPDSAEAATEPVTEESIRSYCRTRIAHFKVPRYVRFVDDFPKTISGKIQKFRIREAMIAELGLVEDETA